MLVPDEFNNKMQITITLLGCLIYLIGHFSGKSHHSLFNTYTFLHYTIDTP